MISYYLRGVLNTNIYNTIKKSSFVNLNAKLTNTVGDNKSFDTKYNKICLETLESLFEYFEEITEENDQVKSGDVTYKDGVLTVDFGKMHGTYVINRQSPNRQIWVSSPKSGPKRFDLICNDKKQIQWIYKHTGETLHEILQREVKAILKSNINFFNLPYGHEDNNKML